jgi:hypothetical protein
MTDWYEYPSNFSNGTSVDGIGSFYQYLNSAGSSWTGAVFVLIIWVVVFGFSLAAGSRKAIATASFVSFIFAVYFSILGMLNPVVPICLIVLTIIGAIGSKGDAY